MQLHLDPTRQTTFKNNGREPQKNLKNERRPQKKNENGRGPQFLLKK
jgi:hypothetical protein